MKTLQLNGEGKVIFLNNVSIISLDLPRNRIVFNFMNNIHLFGRWTPDYHYFSFDSSQEALEYYESLKRHPYFRINFFISFDDENTHMVNKSAVTSISVKEEELKIIFNLNYAVTSYKGNEEVEISKFIFWNYMDEDLFDDDRLEVYMSISNIEI
jgi:hypothetical protein